jgi:predicted membrane metal-binding protein
MSTHDPLVSHRKNKLGSDRSFAMVFAGFFAIVALAPLLHGGPMRWWAIALAAVFAAVGFVAPRFLSPLNRLWFRLGLALSRVVSPVVMGIVYYVVVVPTGLIIRARRKDPLRLRREPEAPTYWIRREPPGPTRGSMSRQF